MQRKIKRRRLCPIFMLLFLPTLSTFSQERAQQVIPLEQIWQLVIKNNRQLKIKEKEVEIASQQIRNIKQSQLPTISTKLDIAYLGDIHIYDNDLTNKVNVEMPPLGNSFTIQAKQLIYKGKTVKRHITNATLEHQLSEIKKEATTQDIKLLATGMYLDLYRLHNQRQVYKKNIELAQIRLHNTEALYRQELVTQDDVLRMKFMLSKLQITHDQIDNNLHIVNHRLATTIGLSSTILIIPDTTILLSDIPLDNCNVYLNNALKENPNLLMTNKRVEIAQNALSITKSELSPTISLFAINNLQNPLTSSVPIQDKYTNSWKVGVTLSLDISSFYKSNRKREIRRLQIVQSEEAEALQKEQIDIEIHSAYLKYKENLKELETFKKNKQLAHENYRMIEKKYDNQIALLIDILHASNTKLAAELDVANAEINALFSYYKLLKITGSL